MSSDSALSWCDDPIRPPFRWTNLEKVDATKAGFEFCWWCGSTEIMASGVDHVDLGPIRVPGASVATRTAQRRGETKVVQVTKRACHEHASEVAKITASDPSI